jgi:hypothetical protein
MKILIIIITILIVSVIFFGLRQKQGSSKPSVQQFVSMTCEKGDITLSINSDGDFTMVLKYWDPKTNQHTHEDLTSGSWEKKEGLLVLKTSDSELTYKPSTNSFKIGNSSTSIEGYDWISSIKKTPFDTYSLVEKQKTDAFLLNASE